MSDRDPTTFNLPDLECLDAGHIDNVARAVLTLSREVAVLSDRVMVLEELLEQNDHLTRDAIDSYQPDDAFKARSDAALGRIARNVIAALQGADASG